MTLDNTDTLVSIALGLIGLLAALFGWLRWIRPRLHKATTRVGAALDTIAGREAIVDNITGRELAPALPSIGERMDTMERTVAMLAEQQVHQTVQDKRIADAHERLDAHADRIKQLEDSTIERIAGKAESVAAWKAVAAVANQSDPFIETVDLDDDPDEIG